MNTVKLLILLKLVYNKSTDHIFRLQFPAVSCLTKHGILQRDMPKIHFNEKSVQRFPRNCKHVNLICLENETSSRQLHIFVCFVLNVKIVVYIESANCVPRLFLLPRKRPWLGLATWHRGFIRRQLLAIYHHPGVDLNFFPHWPTRPVLAEVWWPADNFTGHGHLKLLLDRLIA